MESAKAPLTDAAMLGKGTQFIGRSRELADLRRLLADPACRLVSVVGPGGVGKTRLAAELLRDLTPVFADGGCFVALQPVTSTETFVAAIADAIGIQYRASGRLLDQVAARLSTARMLLVLDNLEHLVDVVSEPLTEILASAPGVKLLVSSREPLSLEEEWVYQIDGMAYPKQAEDADFGSYDAVRLLCQRLSQAKSTFAPSQNREAVLRICRLVDGVPLALELAATWITTLECGEIADEIETSIDFLRASRRNMPARHHSMRAVFDESWRRLSESEQSVFKRLSVFPASFRRDAAEAVAGGALSVLHSLVDRSLLRQLPGGRFQLHELVRQFAAEKLSETAEDVYATSIKHCKYYAAVLQRCYENAFAGQQLQLCSEFEEEIENIRTAWQAATRGPMRREIGQMSGALAMFGQFRCRYLDAAIELRKAAEPLRALTAPEQEERLLLAGVLVAQSWFEIRLGRINEAQSAAEAANHIYESLGLLPREGWASDPAANLSVVASIRGDYEGAEQFGRLALKRSDETDNPWNQEIAYYVLTRSAQLTGRQEEAERFALEARRIALALNDRWFLAYCLLELGNVSALADRLDDARSYYESSYRLREEFGDGEGMAVALISLGDIAMRQDAFAEARDFYDRSLALYRDINDAGGTSNAYLGRAKASVALGDFDASREALENAMSLAVKVGFVPLVLSILVALAAHLLSQSRRDDGEALLRFVAREGAADFETRAWLNALIAQYGSDLHVPSDPPEVARIVESTLGQPFDATLRQIGERKSPGSEPKAGAERRGADDLTDREIEVLRLIAQGKSNREIAEELFITANTVANHVKSILAKSASANRAEAVTYASRRGLI